MEPVKIAHGNLCLAEHHINEIIVNFQGDAELKIKDSVNPKTYNACFFFRLNMYISSVMDNRIVKELVQQLLKLIPDNACFFKHADFSVNLFSFFLIFKHLQVMPDYAFASDVKLFVLHAFVAQKIGCLNIKRIGKNKTQTFFSLNRQENPVCKKFQTYFFYHWKV